MQMTYKLSQKDTRELLNGLKDIDDELKADIEYDILMFAEDIDDEFITFTINEWIETSAQWKEKLSFRHSHLLHHLEK